MTHFIVDGFKAGGTAPAVGTIDGDRMLQPKKSGVQSSQKEDMIWMFHSI